ncbi:MAG: T9SS type A sorting domain-containing protein [Bacteroidales bacterium]|nr:T9SS type A sorting domain-containing protein [Bacteroidales bacterium]
MKKFKLIAVLIFISLLPLLNAQQLAFPGAEGFGKYSAGGRSGIVIYVTNLNDAGAGSLREALTSNKGQKRTIVFSVSGTIELQSTIEIKYDSYITVAGQTAPGDGICIKNFPLKVGDSHDIIFRYIRFRLGDEQDCGSETGCDDFDALAFRRSYNIVLDHCSLSWSIDDILDLTVMTGYSSVQWCILHEPLTDSKHSKGSHGYIAGWDGSSYGGGAVFGGGSYHHNLLVSGASRTPRLDKYPGDGGERDLIDIVNNVIYNWSGYGAYGGEAADVNWHNNYHKYGPNTSNKSQIFLPGDTCRMHMDGNYVYGYPNVTADNSKGISASTLLSVSQILQDNPFDVWSIDMQPAIAAYNSVLLHSGAYLPNRDSCDARIVNDVINRTGKIIDSQSEVGGWPVLNSTTAPVDTDLDGMPDHWENKMGLDSSNATDRNIVTANGYTQLELYLNSIEFQKIVPNVIYKYDQNGQILVTWDDIYIGEDTFRVERSIDGSEFVPIGYVLKNISQFVDDSTFQLSEVLQYRVIAVQHGVTESPASEIISATTLELQVEDTIHVGDTLDIKVVFDPQNTTNQLIGWELSQLSDTISELNQSGQFIAKSTGIATVIANLLDGSDVSVSKTIVIEAPVLVKNVMHNWKEMVSIYPNPSRDGLFNVYIDPNLTEVIQINVFDISGRKVYENDIEQKGIISLPFQFENGIYLMNLGYKEHNQNFKIIVSR